MCNDISKKLSDSENRKENTNSQMNMHNPTNEKTIGSLYYEGTPKIEKLLTEETPKQILTEDFPEHQWPIGGGWGYSEEDAVAFELDDHREIVNLEYKFLEYRTYEEAIIFRSIDEQLAGFRFEKDIQSFVRGSDGRIYDKVTLKVTAFTEDDFALLKRDWESHNAYQNDEDGKIRHLQLADSKAIKYKITGWFDISNFYGKG